MAAGAGAAYLALTNAVGCELLGRATKNRPSHPSRVSPLPGVLPAPSNALWGFRSRPDLGPPAVEVAKTRVHDTASGYVFVAPQEGSAGQGGPLILDNEGQVVWFRPLKSEHGRPMTFEVQNYRGRPVLTWVVMGPGECVICDASYREIARFTAANGLHADHHEFLISPQDTALITAYEPVPRDLSSFGGPRDGVAVQGIVQEMDIETGEVLFEWHSLEHVGLDETYAKPYEDRDYPGIDYFHVNSVDVDHDGNLLVSARKTSAVYKIDRKTGEIIWRLGGKRSDFEMGRGARFAFQHDARRQRDGTITIFDNGKTVFENGTPRAVEEARAIVLELDERKMTASLVRQYNHPAKLYADASGSVQVLPNGNVFVGWGRALFFSEFSHDGELLFDGRLPHGNRSYRAFRFPWEARPTDVPALAAEHRPEGKAAIYASWNGATEVESWEVLVGAHAGRLESVGSVPRDGFETAMVAQTSDQYIAVRAKGRSGSVLGTTEPINTLRRD